MVISCYETYHSEFGSHMRLLIDEYNRTADILKECGEADLPLPAKYRILIDEMSNSADEEFIRSFIKHVESDFRFYTRIRRSGYEYLVFGLEDSIIGIYGKKNLTYGPENAAEDHMLSLYRSVNNMKSPYALELLIYEEG